MEKDDANNGLTVREYAEKHGVGRAAVRYAISRNYLRVDRESKPMRVVGGNLALTVQRWRASLEPVVKELKPSLFGWADAPARIEMLRGTEVVVVEYDEDWRSIPAAMETILGVARVHRGAP